MSDFVEDAAYSGKLTNTHYPKFTIIVAVLNGVEFVGRCVASVAAQTYEKKELIVIDGGSTDGTVEILQSLEHSITHWMSEPDNGISDAWNKGINRATGDWLCFLGADDYIADPAVLEKVAEHLKKAAPKHLVAYGDVVLVHKNGQLIERSGSPWDRKRFERKGMTFSHQGVFHHRSLFPQVGLFDRRYRLAGDYEWILRAISRTEPLYLSGLTVAAMQTGGRSADDANGILVLSEYARAQRQHFGRVVPWALGWTALKVMVKRLLKKTVGERTTRWVIDSYRVMTGRPPRRKNFFD